MAEDTSSSFALRPFLIELAVYSVLVVAYVFFVLHYLNGWLKGLFDLHRVEYAWVSVTLMIVQAVGLEAVTTGLLRFFRRRG